MLSMESVMESLERQCKKCKEWHGGCKVWRWCLQGHSWRGLTLLSGKDILIKKKKSGRKGGDSVLRIGICDDETSARDTLWMQLSKLLREGSEEVVYDFSSGRSAVNWLEKHPGEIDLLFLDVEMEGLNGMETARRIREFNENLLIVFVTGYADYVFDGYSVGALDYLIKPVKEKRLAAVLGRVREKMYREDAKSFVVKNTEGIYRFSYKDILYFYSEKRKVALVTASGEYAFYDKLDAVEKRLGEDFVRIHQRYLVCADAVSRIGKTFVEVGEYTLPVSRSLREKAAGKLAKAMLEG